MEVLPIIIVCYASSLIRLKALFVTSEEYTIRDVQDLFCSTVLIIL